MNGSIMLKRTYDLLMARRRLQEEKIKKYLILQDIPKEKRERKIIEARNVARECAPYIRKAVFIEDLALVDGVVTFGCDVYLEREEEKKIITILGRADILFNPKYRHSKRYLGYGSIESLAYIGKRTGDVVSGWKIAKIEKFEE